jgi:alpha-beta hydrolase superfamily lysophospholipase
LIGCEQVKTLDTSSDEEQIKENFKNYVYFFILIGLISCNIEDKKSIVEKGFAQVNGTKLYYGIAGTGEPLVLLHGNFGDRRHWDFQFYSLSKNYKVIRYDVRGYGKSALPKSDEQYNDYNDLKALLDFLEIEKAHIWPRPKAAIH